MVCHMCDIGVGKCVRLCHRRFHVGATGTRPSGKCARQNIPNQRTQLTRVRQKQGLKQPNPYIVAGHLTWGSVVTVA